MKADKLAEALDKISDCFITEAEKYGSENIDSSEEISSESQSKSNLYYILPAVAACAVLCLTVNHFTDYNKPGKTEINNTTLSAEYSQFQNTTPALYTEQGITSTSHCISESYILSDSVIPTYTTSISEKYTGIISEQTITNKSDIQLNLSVPVSAATVYESTSGNNLESVSSEFITSKTHTTTIPQETTREHTSNIQEITTGIITETTEPIIDEPDLFDEVLNSFGDNVILLNYSTDYGKENNGALMITEDGNYKYLIDKKSYNYSVTMNPGKNPPEIEVNEKLNSVSNIRINFYNVKGTDQYTFFIPKEYSDLVFDVLKSSSDVKEINEFQYIDEVEIRFNGMYIQTEMSEEDVISKYSVLNLVESNLNLNLYPDWKYYFYCSPIISDKFYQTVTEMQNEEVKFKFDLGETEGLSQHYASRKIIIYSAN